MSANKYKTLLNRMYNETWRVYESENLIGDVFVEYWNGVTINFCKMEFSEGFLRLKIWCHTCVEETSNIHIKSLMINGQSKKTRRYIGTINDCGNEFFYINLCQGIKSEECYVIELFLSIDVENCESSDTRKICIIYDVATGEYAICLERQRKIHRLNDVEAKCTRKLMQIFLRGVPEKIQECFEREIQYLKQSEYFEEFYNFYIESKIKKEMICSKGSISGSIVYFLLSECGYNPLPPHYYCTDCGYYEPIHRWKNCVDASDKSCPQCGNTIKAAGYNVSIESVWGLDGKKAIGFEKEEAIHPVVEKRLNQLIEEFKPQSFEDKIKLCACAANTYAWEKNGDEELDLDRFKSFILSQEFKACTFYTREELFENLCSKGMSPTQAYKVSEFVRRGGVVRRRNEVHKYEIPEEVVSVAQNISYLESRAHAIQTAYRYWKNK